MVLGKRSREESMIAKDCKNPARWKGRTGRPSGCSATRAQLMAQGLLLRDHGYTCDHGFLYLAIPLKQSRHSNMTNPPVRFAPQLSTHPLRQGTMIAPALPGQFKPAQIPTHRLRPLLELPALARLLLHHLFPKTTRHLPVRRQAGPQAPVLEPTEEIAEAADLPLVEVA